MLKVMTFTSYRSSGPIGRDGRGWMFVVRSYIWARKRGLACRVVVSLMGVALLALFAG